jgi:gamma-glutamylcyclotransferase
MNALYFAYGSNLDPAQMRERLPGARAVGVAQLVGFRIVFDKPGRDGSGKANLAADAHGSVWGALYELVLAEMAALDAFEGGYVRERVSVKALASPRRNAVTYRSSLADPRAVPAPWYAARVLAGARAHGLPPAYVAALEATLEARSSCPP